ncbi:MAG: serine/threonine-protein kinase [Thermoanaerobaculia bacterium]
MLSIESLRQTFFAALPRYRYLGLLGRGGMGIVFKAEDADLDEVIAIKVLSSLFQADSDGLLARFKREISLNRKIKHPNVARLYDFGMSGSLPFITMEFVEGLDLSRRLADSGPFTPSRATAVLRQIALGASAAHQAGIVHRDIKPQNIMVDDDGAVAILDFGMARGSGGPILTLRGEAVGTPQYMSPEQARGQAMDARSDIYSIGVIAFELLTGRLLFDGDSPLEVAMRQVEDRVPSERLTEHAVPPALSAIILCCLEKSPEKRFQTAADLEAHLALLGGASRPDEKASVPMPLDLEMVMEPSPSVRTLPSRRTAASAGARPLVLVVDDEPMIRELVSIYLRESGCETVEATTGQAAIEQLMAHTPDLVLMDVMMPVMDGFDAMRVIRAQPEHDRLPIVLMSTLLERSRLAFAIQAGATDFIAKPIDMPKLVDTVWKILEAGPAIARKR